jgi:cyclase
MDDNNIQRGLIVARIKPGAQDKVAELFAQSDAGELPALAGVRHRSLFALGDVYVHLVELDRDFAGAVSDVREHPLFRELSAKLDAYIEPYDPATWRSPKDAMAAEFYRWDAA